jgi:hypothetical protein
MFLLIWLLLKKKKKPKKLRLMAQVVENLAQKCEALYWKNKNKQTKKTSKIKFVLFAMVM